MEYISSEWIVQDELDENESDRAASRTLTNFILMSVLFSANHGCVVACLSKRRLVSFRGCLAEWNASILTYTGSAIFGATYFVKSWVPCKRLGDWNVVLLRLCGMLWLAVTWQRCRRPAALIGAAIGGMKGLWTAPRSLFLASGGRARESTRSTRHRSDCPFGWHLAFIYLAALACGHVVCTFATRWLLSGPPSLHYSS
jgi:hypothetical protein